MKLNRYLFLVIAMLLSLVSKAQNQALPNFDIVMFKLEQNKGEYYLAQPQIVTNRPDYDNQPAFSADDKTIYFTHMENNKTDIWQWSLDSKQAKVLHETSLSEYSATLIPDTNNEISVIRVEEDQTQRLWKFNQKGEFTVIFEDVKPVGYHAWNDDNVAMFILAEPNELHIAKAGQNTSTKLDQNIGRCIQRIPDSNQFSYTVIENERHMLKSITMDGATKKSLFSLPSDTQDYVWLNNNQVISSDGNKLYIRDINDKSGWKKIKNSTNFKISKISRLAISNNKTMLAVVVEKQR
ncbi:MAG: hypothetical protein OEY96_10355 [Gammaproteobacteria bacterium]|nr:hypothetical protein [Gammaproteobacteria bacterium]